MFDFIRLQLKLKWGFNRNNSKRNAIMTAVAAVLAVGVALALVWGLSFVLKTSVGVAAKELSTLFLSILIVGLTVVATGMQIKRLYNPADINITARFPLSSFKIFVSSLILNYIDLTIYSTVLVVPIMLVFGWAMNCITVAYVFGIILGALFMPLIPFALSVFLAIPIMYVNTLLKKHNIIKLVVFIILLVVLFVLYYYILTILANFFIHRNWEEGTIGIWKALITGLNSVFNPAHHLASIVFFENFWLGFGVILGVSVVLLGLGVVVAKFVYQNIRTKQLEGGALVNTRRSKLDEFGSTRAMLKHNFLEILHTKSYSYFYLGVAISTPVMVFFCNRLVDMVGQAQIGKNINFGAAMLVVSIFMAMIGSFAALIISMEGRNFYITKLIPMSYRRQLLVKALVNIVVSIGALLVSVVVLACLKFLNAVEIVVLLVSQILFVFGLVFNGLNINLVNPNIKPKANGEAEEINITYMLMIGIVVAAGFGLVGFMLPKAVPNGSTWAYVGAVAIGLVYALVNFLVFFFTANRKYGKIE